MNTQTQKFHLPKVKGKGLKVLKLIHLLGIMPWISGCLAAFILMLFIKSSTNSDEIFYFLNAIEILDFNAIVIGAIFTVLLGIFYGLFTNWGFIKMRWLVIKWLVSIFIIVSGIQLYIPNIDAMRNLLATHRIAAVQGAEFWYHWQILLGIIIIDLLLMAILIALSIFKPKLKKAK